MVQSHLNAMSKWLPTSKLGCGPNDLFYTEGLYAHQLVIVQKNRYADFSIRNGDAHAMAAIGCAPDQFQGLVDEALRRTKSRQASSF